MSIHAYLRVSTDKQATDTQEYDLCRRYPDAVVHRETASGMKQRPILDALIEHLQSGDTIVVAALDRLGRRTSQILALIEDLQKRRINVVSLREGLDYGTPSGRLVTQVMVAVSELERSLISSRTKSAMQALKAKGVKLGRPAKFSPESVAQARNLRASGHTYRQIHAITRISLGQLSTVLK